MKFVTRKYIEVNDLYNGQYSVKKNVSFKTHMIRSDLCDYGHAYIVVWETINLRTSVIMLPLKKCSILVMHKKN